MKSFYKNRLIVIGLIVLFYSPFKHAFAQSEAGNFIRIGASDIQKYGNYYLKPFGDAFGTHLNSGWYNTANPHKLLGFDVTFTMTSIVVPKIERSFNVNNVGFQAIEKNPFSETDVAPTIFGSNKSVTPIMDVIIENPFYGTGIGQSTITHQQDTVLTSVTMPKGVGVNMMMLPNLQIGLGLLPGTEFTGRYCPSMDVMGKKISGNITYYGVGVMHSIKQYIKVLPFSLSLQGAYSKFNYNYTFPQPVLPIAGSVLDDGSVPEAETYNNQKLNFDVSAVTANLIVSKKILMLTIYGSGGYNFVNSSFNIKGTYPVVTGIGSDPTDLKTFKKKITTDFIDPLSFKSQYSGFRGNLGLKFNYLVFTLHAEYTYAYYQTITAGFGISFR